jgi:putative aldouronate transport system substrate-binding protein
MISVRLRPAAAGAFPYHRKTKILRRDFMRKMKRILCLVVVLVFSLSLMLAGCGAQKTEEAGGTPAEAAGGTAAEAASAAEPVSAVPKDEVTLTWYQARSDQQADTQLVVDKVNEYLKDKINIKLDLQYFPFGEGYDTKINTALASGEPIDIVFTASWSANYYLNAPAGYFTELNGYIEKYPAIKEILGEDFLNASRINGKNYALPCNKEKAHNWGYLLKKDLVDKYGIDRNTLKKMEDLEPWFEKIKTGEPGITPLLVVNMDSPFHFLDWDNISDDDVPGALPPDNSSTTIVNHFEAPKTIDMFKKLREYYQKGYIAKDAATMENTQQQMSTGKYFAVEQSLKPQDMKAAEMSAATGVEWVEVKMTEPVMTNRETTGSMLAIPAGSKNPERAYQFIEYLYTDKYVKNLLNFGIEGTHYTVNADGRITITQDGKDRYNPGNTWTFGDQMKDLILDNEDPKKWDTFPDYNAKALPLTSLGFVFNKTPVETQANACKAVIGVYNKQLMCGAVDTDSTIKKMSAELKASGVDALIAEMQKQYDEWRAANGK